MGLMSPKHVVLGILSGYPATEVDLLIPSLPAREYRFESCLRHQLETAPQVCWFRSAFTMRTFRVFQAQLEVLAL
jgi:hypothetical protein